MAGGLAFFDLDRTLIRRNSATLWLQFERAEGRITRLQTLQALSWVLRYSLGSVDMAEPIRRSVAALAGQREVDMRERVRCFYDELVRPFICPSALARLCRVRSSPWRWRADETLYPRLWIIGVAP